MPRPRSPRSRRLVLAACALAAAVLAAACSGSAGMSSPVGPSAGGSGGGGTQSHATFQPTTADLPNPDRGFYGWAGDDFIASFDVDGVRTARANGQRLVLATVSLADYRQADLPAGFLAALGANLDAVRAEGMKVTLVFAYDFSATGDDAPASRIVAHLDELAPVLAAHADVIPYMRAGFIGAWGEWHSSQNGNSCDADSTPAQCATAAANRAQVRDALLADVPPTTQIGFRFPSDVQAWYPAGDGPSRVGLDDDCFLSGPSDTGTFTLPGQRSWAQALTRRAAFGGETCDNGEMPVRSRCADILSEGAQYHLAWLNGQYSATVIDGWSAGGCRAQVSASMGYRLQLDQVTHDPAVDRGGTLSVSVDLRDVGWARMFTARALTVTLRARADGTTFGASGGDLSALPPQATASTRIALSVPVPASAPPGDYDVLLSAPDVFPSIAGDARFAVRFANADVPDAGQQWDPATGAWHTGTVVTVH